MEVREIHKKPINKADPVVYDEKLKKMRKEHEKLIKGMFEFTDAKGGWFEFTNRTFPGESIKYFRIVHGEICELPMGIAKLLNNTKRKIRKIGVGIAERGGELPSRGLPSTYETESRVKFIPMDVL